MFYMSFQNVLKYSALTTELYGTTFAANATVLKFLRIKDNKQYRYLWSILCSYLVSHMTFKMTSSVIKKNKHQNLDSKKKSTVAPIILNAITELHKMVQPIWPEENASSFKKNTMSLEILWFLFIGRVQNDKKHKKRKKVIVEPKEDTDDCGSNNEEIELRKQVEELIQDCNERMTVIEQFLQEQKEGKNNDTKPPPKKRKLSFKFRHEDE